MSEFAIESGLKRLEEIVSQERFNGDHEASHTSVHQ